MPIPAALQPFKKPRQRAVARRKEGKEPVLIKGKGLATALEEAPLLQGGQDHRDPLPGEPKHFGKLLVGPGVSHPPVGGEEARWPPQVKEKLDHPGHRLIGRNRGGATLATRKPGEIVPEERKKAWRGLREEGRETRGVDNRERTLLQRTSIKGKGAGAKVTKDLTFGEDRVGELPPGFIDTVERNPTAVHHENVAGVPWFTDEPPFAKNRHRITRGKSQDNPGQLGGTGPRQLGWQLHM